MTDGSLAFDGRFTPRVADFFISNHIFLKHPFKVHNVYSSKTPVRVPAGVRVERYATMPLRCFAQMGAFSYCRSIDVPAYLTTGRYCSIATGLQVMGRSHPETWVATAAFPLGPIADLTGKAATAAVAPASDAPVLGHDVWIGQDVRLAPGVKIGTGSIVAAGSVLTQDVEPYTIVGGVEARPLRRRFPDALIERMLAVEWWRYNYADFGGLPLDQPEAFLDGLEARIAKGEITPFEPGFVDLGEALTAWVAEKPDA